MSWDLAWSHRALHDLEQLDRQLAARAVAAMERYAATEHGAVKQLTAYRPPRWSLRVGVHRLLFQRDLRAHRLDVLRVRHRREAYRD